MMINDLYRSKSKGQSRYRDLMTCLHNYFLNKKSILKILNTEDYFWKNCTFTIFLMAI